MSLPLLPIVAVVAAGGALVYVLATRSSLPPELKGPFDDLLAHGTDPDAIEAVAVKLDQKGFPKEAAQLRAKEAQLRGGAAPRPGPAPATPTGPTPPPAPAPVAPPPVAPPVAPPAPAGPSLPAQFMKVTTHDPPPSGDLALRSDPNASAAVVGAAEKDSVVTVKDVSADGQFILVEALNPAGRRPSMSGWAHAAFLVPTNPMKTSGRFGPASHAPYAGLPYGASIGAILCGAAEPAGGEKHFCACPMGLAIRQLPTWASGTKAMVPENATLFVSQTLAGPKTDRSSPGLGGWALVTEPTTGTRGWVPREWLA